MVVWKEPMEVISYVDREVPVEVEVVKEVIV